MEEIQEQQDKLKRKLAKAEKKQNSDRVEKYKKALKILKKQKKELAKAEESDAEDKKTRRIKKGKSKEASDADSEAESKPDKKRKQSSKDLDGPPVSSVVEPLPKRRGGKNRWTKQQDASHQDSNQIEEEQYPEEQFVELEASERKPKRRGGKNRWSSSQDDAAKKKDRPLVANPLKITRCFLGNLSFKIDEHQLAALLPFKPTHIKWLTDKATGQFYGSGFVEMASADAAAAVVACNGEDFLGRPIKAEFSAPRPGDVWPPEEKVTTGGPPGGPRQAGDAKPAGRISVVSPKPTPDCRKIFLGNVAYEADDDGICKFFEKCGEIYNLRWLSHKDTGEFKGCGYMEFSNTEAADEAVKLNGQMFMGRPLKVDYSE